MDPNIKTEDGLTPLHLAANLGHFEIAKTLIRDFSANINPCHKVFGTPLHCAAREGHLKFVAYLLMCKARIDILIENNISAIEISTNDKITDMLKKYKEHLDRKNYAKKNIQIEELKGLKIKQGIHLGDFFIPPRAPKVKGIIYKLGSMFGAKNQRYFVLNPFECIFAKYKTKEKYPDSPKDIYPLNQIQGLKKLTDLTPTKNRESYYFFEFHCKRKHQFCTKTEKAADLWVKYLNCAIIFSLFLTKIKEIINSPDSTEELKLLNTELFDMIKNEPQDEVIIDDEIKEFIMHPAIMTEPIPTEESDIRSPDNSKSLIASLEEDKTIFDPSSKVTFSSFSLLEKVGSGAFGAIFKVALKSTSEIYAMKAISKRFLFKTKQLKYAKAECQILKQMNHPFIVKMHFAFQTPKYVYFILDFCTGGDLSMHISNKQIFKEEEARIYICELILAIEYLHSLNIVYRDLKPDNILIGEDGHIKLSDFGLAKQMLGQPLSFAGTPQYLSPEMLTQKGGGKEIDVYGIGTILYELLSGLPPHYNEDTGTMFANIRFAKAKIPKYISARARSVLKELLEKNPLERITIPELKKHPFFEGIKWEDVMAKKLAPPLDIKQFNLMSKTFAPDELALVFLIVMNL